MGITYIESVVTGPTGKQATVRLLVDSGATYTLLPYEDWQAIGLSPKRSVTFTLADGTEEATVDIMNDGKVGVDAISPAALPSIPQEIIDLVAQRREQMMNGEWDPFTEHAFVSNGTGLELEGTPIPDAGTEVKPAGEEPTAEWLLSQFNFDLEGVTILE